MGPRPNRTRYSFLSFFLVLLVLLTVVRPAWAWQVKNTYIAPTAWDSIPGGTAATTGNTGFFNIQGSGTINDIAGSDARPSSMTAAKKLVFLNGYAGFILDTNTAANAHSPFPTGSSHTDYMVSFYMKFAADTKTLALAQGSQCFRQDFNVSATSGDPDIYMFGNVANNDPASTLFRNRTGITLRNRSNATVSQGTERYMGGIVGGSVDQPQIPFNTWVKYTRHLHLGTGTSAYVADYVDGKLVALRDSWSTDAAVAENAHNYFLFYWFGGAGISWEIAPSFESWQGLDPSVDPSFPVAERKANLGMTHFFGTEYGPDVATAGKGTYWNWTASVGSPTVTTTPYSTAGIGPYQSRPVISGTATHAGEMMLRPEVGDIGNIPFDALGNSAIQFNNLYVPAGSVTLRLTDRLAGTETTVVSLTVKNGALWYGTRQLAPWDSAGRYSVWLYPSNKGDWNWGLFDLGNDYTSRQIAYSGYLDKIVSLEDPSKPLTKLARVGQAVVLGTAATGSSNIELSQVTIGSKLDVLLGDSYVAAYSTTTGQVSIPVSGGSGTYTANEVVTESVSGATGTFVSLVANVLTMNVTNNGFLGSGATTLTGGSSGATRTAGALAGWTRRGNLRAKNNLTSELNCLTGSQGYIGLWHCGTPSSLNVPEIIYTMNLGASGNNNTDFGTYSQAGLSHVRATRFTIPCWAVNSLNLPATLAVGTKESNAADWVTRTTSIVSDVTGKGNDALVITSPLGTNAAFTTYSGFVLAKEKALLLYSLASLNRPSNILIFDAHPYPTQFYTGSVDGLHPYAEGARWVNANLSGNSATNMKSALVRPSLVNGTVVLTPLQP